MGAANLTTTNPETNTTMSELDADIILDAAHERINQLEKERDRLCEELSGCVSDKIDPSVNVGWMRCSPRLPEYVQGLEKQIAQLTNERDQLAAKVAEMSGLIRRMTGDEWYMDEVVHATSDQCGTGWTSPEKAKVLVGALEHARRSLGATCDDELWRIADRAVKQALEDFK